MADYLFYDVETRSRDVDLRKVGTYRYATNPFTEVLCAALALDDDKTELWKPGQKLPAKFAKHIQKGGLIVAHGVQFEWQIHRHKLGPVHGWPIPEFKQYRCSQSMALALALPPALENISEALGIEEFKDKVGKRVMLQMTKPRKARKNEDPDETYWYEDEERSEKLFEYCIKDVDVMRQGFNVMWPLTDDEQAVFEMDQVINDRGFYVDPDLLFAMRRIISDAAVDIDAQLAKITKGAVKTVGQVAEIKGWLESKFKLKITSLDKKTIPELIARPGMPQLAKDVLELRLAGAQAAVKKVDAFLARRDNDGRVRGSFMYHSAGTGRWASRGAQVHNLKRLTSEDQDEISSAVEDLLTGDYKVMKAKYARPLKIVGDNIRTVICAAPGNVLIGADFSGIEARVTAWVAGELRKIKVFQDYDAGIGPDPYVAAAADVFGMTLADMAKLQKEDPAEYKVKRQGGKGAELAFGFQGGVNAYVKFVPEGLFTLQQIDKFKVKWRLAHPNIKDLWDGLKSAVDKIAKRAAQRSRGLDVSIDPIDVNGLIFEYAPENGGFMFMQLPSGRRIAYPGIGRNMRYKENYYTQKPEDMDRTMGQMSSIFMDNSGGRWHRVFLYGGLVCVAGDTEVLTTAGWKPIVEIQKTDKVWDGVEWVSHDGVVCQGEKIAKALDGVRMTHDHEVLTDNGWVWASQAKGLRRTKVRLPDSHQGHRHDGTKTSVAVEMRLRQENQTRNERICKRQSSILRMQEKRNAWESQPNPWSVSASSVSCLAIDEESLSITIAPRVEELWRARNFCLQTLGRIREFLDRYGSDLSSWFVTGEKKKLRELHSKKLHLGDAIDAKPESTNQRSDQNTLGQDDGYGSGATFGPWGDDAALSDQEYAAKEMVYDLVNCGPRKRFVVRGKIEPFIVHNCENAIQGIARDLLAAAMLRVEAAGFPIVAHVHDECVIEVPKKNSAKVMKEFVRLMCMLPDWAVTPHCPLPVVAKGWMAHRYVK